ncbi:MAG: hypothetical protein D6788_01240 [Planctomycetota bacterium]|nr:MAG: hypothetical protein D6788_01240 [Planctomycetota bacterium]
MAASRKHEPKKTGHRRIAGGPASPKRPALRFVITLVVLLAVFNYVYYVAFVRHHWLDRYLEGSATIAAAVLNVCGEQVTAQGTSVTSSRFTMQVAPGCDAIQAVALFAFAVLAFPARVRFGMKLLAALVGSVLLLIINMIRIISLYYVGVYLHAHFETIHIDVWQTAFIFLPIFFWLAWIWKVFHGTSQTPQHAG